MGYIIIRIIFGLAGSLLVLLVLLGFFRTATQGESLEANTGLKAYVSCPYYWGMLTIGALLFAVALAS